MKKYYIVQELGSEYNDEVYTIQESGKPQRVFSNKIAAQEYCDNKNRKKLENENLGEWGYGLNEVISDISCFVSVYNELFSPKIEESELEDSYEFTLPKMTKVQYIKIKKFLKINFYEIVECEGDSETEKSTKNSVLKQIELENTLGESDKIWCGTLYSNLDVITEWGRRGYELQNKEFKEAGEDFLNKKVKEKLNKGYIEV